MLNGILETPPSFDNLQKKLVQKLHDITPEFHEVIKSLTYYKELSEQECLQAIEAAINLIIAFSPNATSPESVIGKILFLDHLDSIHALVARIIVDGVGADTSHSLAAQIAQQYSIDRLEQGNAVFAVEEGLGDIRSGLFLV